MDDIKIIEDMHDVSNYPFDLKKVRNISACCSHYPNLTPRYYFIRDPNDDKYVVRGVLAFCCDICKQTFLKTYQIAENGRVFVDSKWEFSIIDKFNNSWIHDKWELLVCKKMDAVELRQYDILSELNLHPFNLISGTIRDGFSLPSDMVEKIQTLAQQYGATCDFSKVKSPESPKEESLIPQSQCSDLVLEESPDKVTQEVQKEEVEEKPIVEIKTDPFPKLIDQPVEEPEIILLKKNDSSDYLYKDNILRFNKWIPIFDLYLTNKGGEYQKEDGNNFLMNPITFTKLVVKAKLDDMEETFIFLCDMFKHSVYSDPLITSSENIEITTLDFPISFNKTVVTIDNTPTKIFGENLKTFVRFGLRVTTDFSTSAVLLENKIEQDMKAPNISFEILGVSMNLYKRSAIKDILKKQNIVYVHAEKGPMNPQQFEQFCKENPDLMADLKTPKIYKKEEENFEFEEEKKEPEVEEKYKSYAKFHITMNRNTEIPTFLEMTVVCDGDISVKNEYKPLIVDKGKEIFIGLEENYTKETCFVFEGRCKILGNVFEGAQIIVRSNDENKFSANLLIDLN